MLAIDSITTLLNEASAHQLRYAYLNFKGHPRGLLMLKSLCASGFVPELVIDEASEQADKGRIEQVGYLSQVGHAPDFDTSALSGAYGFPSTEVSNHNDRHCARLLSDLMPDLIVLGDTRILRQHIISTPRIGIINVHPGLLPDVRGNNPYVWAILRNLSQGVTSHFIDAGVDTGPIIKAVPISLDGVSSYPSLLATLNQACATLIVDTMAAIFDGTVLLQVQPEGHSAFREASQEMKEQAAKAIELYARKS